MVRVLWCCSIAPPFIMRVRHMGRSRSRSRITWDICVKFTKLIFISVYCRTCIYFNLTVISTFHASGQQSSHLISFLISFFIRSKSKSISISSKYFNLRKDKRFFSNAFQTLSFNKKKGVKSVKSFLHYLDHIYWLFIFYSQSHART